MNTVAQKNELIFNYSSGKLGEAKSLFVSMYLFLNSVAAKNASIFDNILAQNLVELDEVAPKKLNYKDCIAASSKENFEFQIDIKNPFLYHKTTNRKIYEDAAGIATHAQEALLFNTRGYVTESTIANLVYCLNDHHQRE